MTRDEEALGIAGSGEPQQIADSCNRKLIIFDSYSNAANSTPRGFAPGKATSTEAFTLHLLWSALRGTRR